LDRSKVRRRDVARRPLGAAALAVVLASALACSSQEGGSGAGGSGSGGSGAGGSVAGAGGRLGSGGSSGAGGHGGMIGSGGALGIGGHDISPVICGTTTCALGSQCCVGCNGARSCAPACTSPVCPVDAGGGDASGAIPCGTTTCAANEACVHPPGPGTCLMPTPDGGQCPNGTSLQGSCCLPPDHPSCVRIDGPCSGPTLSCACFSVDPCGAQSCAAAIFRGRDVTCLGA
jgi:hypothetical protein